MIINTGNFSPKWSQPFQTTEYKRRIIKEQSDKWLAEGVIENSMAHWASPVFLITQGESQGRIKH